MAGFWDWLAEWCGKYEPIFNLVQILFVIICGSVLASYIGVKQTQIAEKQTKLADLQLRYTAFEFLPNFTIVDRQDVLSGAGIGLNVRRRLEVTWRQKGVRYLRGKAVLFVEDKPDENKVRRVAINGFYGPEDKLTYPSETESSAINFHRPLAHHILALLKFSSTPSHLTPWDQPPANISTTTGDFKVEVLQSQFGLDKSAEEAKRNTKRQVFTYIELTYKTPAEDEAVDRFVMEYPDRDIRPVASEPVYDKLVALSSERGRESPDYHSTIAAINVALGAPVPIDPNYMSLGEWDAMLKRTMPGYPGYSQNTTSQKTEALKPDHPASPNP
jgi:hypothetical protein